MGPGLLILLQAAVALPAAAQHPTDTLAFPDPATRALVARAAARHRQQDALVTDYRALLRYRLSFAIGQRRWARMPPAAVEEQEARVAWQLPNDLRVDFLGQRGRTRSGDSDLNSVFTRPWFVPRGVGDSVRIFGDDFPERAALHPLAADGPEWYRYALGDTLGITLPGGESLTLVSLDFAPRRTAPALIVGRMWLDQGSGEVVRLSFRYVGTGLWTLPEGDTRRDSSAARRANSLINRILTLSGDLEYARQEGRFWMPYRQVISGRVQLPLVSDLVVPFEAVTTFSEYSINTGQPVTFMAPLDTATLGPVERRARRDSLRAERREGRSGDGADSARTWTGRLTGGGRFELRRPPADSLRAYAGWGDSLEFDLSAADARRIRESLADLERMAARLPGPLTGRQAAGIAFERLADIARYNRVQGLSFGVGYQWRPGDAAFTQLVATLRYGLSDGRVTSRVSLGHDAPSGRLTVSGFREVRGVDPLMQGGELWNSVRALVTARDENDYLLATGGRASFETSLAVGTELTAWAGFERQRGPRTRAHSAINEFLGGTGEFAPNGAVTAGDFAVGGLRLDGGLGTRTRWMLATDAQAGGGRFTGRLWGRLEQRIAGPAGPTLRAGAGAASRAVADQMAFRAGAGRTVRGFDYGAQRGQAFWSAQVQVPTGGRWYHPVFYLDAAQAGMLSGSQALSRRPVLVGVGVGFRLLGGLVWLDRAANLTEPQ